MKNRPWKRWFLRWKRSQHGWKKGWQNNDRTMRKISDRHDLYKGDNIGIYTYIYIYKTCFWTPLSRCWVCHYMPPLRALQSTRYPQLAVVISGYKTLQTLSAMFDPTNGIAKIANAHIWNQQTASILILVSLSSPIHDTNAPRAERTATDFVWRYRAQSGPQIWTCSVWCKKTDRIYIEGETGPSPAKKIKSSNFPTSSNPGPYFQNRIILEILKDFCSIQRPYNGLNPQCCPKSPWKSRPKVHTHATLTSQEDKAEFTTRLSASQGCAQNNLGTEIGWFRWFWLIFIDFPQNIAKICG